MQRLVAAVVVVNVWAHTDLQLLAGHGNSHRGVANLTLCCDRITHEGPSMREHGDDCPKTKPSQH